MMSSKDSCTKPVGLLRHGSLAIAGILAAAMAANAQTTSSILDNYEAGSNQNLFLGYSYFYNEAADGGTSQVTTSKPGATATELLVDPLKSFDAGYNSTKSLKMDFVYGANKPKSCGGTCSYGQMVGFGTQFVPGTDALTGTDGKTLDLTGATAISFYAKGSVAMKVRVEITTTTVKDFAFHRGEVTVTTDWAKYTVMLIAGLGGINQPSWTTTPVTFDPTKVQKLQFQVSADDNATLTAGTLWLDDVAVEGYSWVPPNACMSCVGPGPATGAVLGDLEPSAAPLRAANQNATGGFWFVYNDVGTRTVAGPTDYSEIFEGVTANTLDPTKPTLAVSPTKGVGGSGAAYIKFALGPTYTEGTNVIQPFVGIGTKTSDDLETMYMDATASTGIAFDYNTDAASTFKFIRLEVKTNQTDLGTNAGVVHSVLLPATGGTWKTATVPWEKFSLPDWDEVPNKLAPVKKAGILKFQWAVQDAPKTSGSLAIDNVKMLGMTEVKPLSLRGYSRAARGLKAHQAAGRLDVAFNLPAGAEKAEISLVDMKGSRVASRIVGKGEKLASLDVAQVRSGLYSLQVRHNGGVVASSSVTLLK